ncbi:MAG: hypothetical protein JNM09_06615 [Blastocatellia bacterium]|nr:hypothetical protein [Blastocatellia bacterium]
MKCEYTKERYAITALLWLLLLTFSAFAQTLNLEGRWEMYNDKGEKYDKPAKVAGGKDKVKIDNGYGAQSTAVLQGNTLTTSDGLTGTISADGTKINWSNAYVWVRQDARWNRAEVTPIPDTPPSRKIKIFNNAGFVGRMTATYYNQQGVAKTLKTKGLMVLQSETLEIPPDAPPKPIEIKFLKGTGINAQGNDTYAEFSTATIPASFSGELCYRVEGTMVNPVVSNCDNSIGDATNSDVRQIRFQNDAGYDAQMTITYFVNEVVNGNSIPMPKTISSGFINGLGGKFRMLNIPQNTAPNMPIQIILGGNATVKDGIFATTLPADFAASPAPCFKVWGTLFDPKGGTCNQ